MKEERGSLSLEAIMIIPLFLVFMLGMITLVRVVTTEMILQHAVTETVKRTAVELYPIKPTLQQLTEHWYSSLEDLPEPLHDLIELGAHTVEEELWKSAMRSFIGQHLSSSNLDRNKLVVNEVILPRDSEGDSHFGIIATYQMSIHLPFYNKTWMIQKRAYERVWTGG